MNIFGVTPLLIFALLIFVVEIKTEDAVYVLAYSIIMLNTDLHNPQVRASATFFVTLLL